MYDPSEALLQLGLYDYVWGDPGLLQTYNANVQAEKARQEQNAYNKMWKAIEDQKAKERADAEKREKLSQLYKDYNNAAGEQERAIIAEQISNLKGDSVVEDRMLNAYNADRAAKQKADRDEALRHSAALREIADIEAQSRKLKKAAQKDALANSVYDTKTYPNMNDAERDKLYASLKGIKALDEKVSEAVEGAAASHASKKATEAMDLNDVLARASQPGYVPTSDDKATAKKNGYIWDKIQKNYVRAK